MSYDFLFLNKNCHDQGLATNDVSTIGKNLKFDPFFKNIRHHQPNINMVTHQGKINLENKIPNITSKKNVFLDK